MPSLFPSYSILQDAFSLHQPFRQARAEPLNPSSHRDRFIAWSAVDDVKSRAGNLSTEAQKELSKASQTAQAKAGTIELYSGKYYAACTFGGLIACVSNPSTLSQHRLTKSF